MNSVDQMWFHIQAVDLLKNSNISFRSIVQAEQDRDSFAKIVRNRIVHHAFRALTKSRMKPCTQS